MILNDINNLIEEGWISSTSEVMTPTDAINKMKGLLDEKLLPSPTLGGNLWDATMNGFRQVQLESLPSFLNDKDYLKYASDFGMNPRMLYKFITKVKVEASPEELKNFLIKYADPEKISSKVVQVKGDKSTPESIVGFFSSFGEGVRNNIFLPISVILILLLLMKKKRNRGVVTQ